MDEKQRCHCCNRELEDFEEEKLDCGHVACNSCTYSDLVIRSSMICENCKWKRYGDEAKV